MTRVLFLTSLYPPHHLGGAELSCHDVANRLTERGHDVAVLCADTRLSGVPDATGQHERRVHRDLHLYLRGGEPWVPGLRQRLAIERHNQAALDAALVDQRPEVVSVWHMGAMSLGLLATLARRQMNIVYAVCDEWLAYETTLDGWARLWWGSKARRLAGRVAGYLTGVPAVVGDLGRTGAFLWVSDLTRRHVLQNAPWEYPCSTVVYSGIDTRAFPPVTTSSVRPWRWRLAFVGRFDPRKGPETALRALPLLPPEATLGMYGRGGTAERDRLASIADELGVTDQVTFGELSRDQLAAVYRNVDAVVFPSEWEEPFGLVPIEAMSCGTPVVATATGGSAEFLIEGDNFLRFPPRDHVALAAAVRRLAGDPVLRRHLVAGGLETVAQLDVDQLTDVFEAWHQAAARRYADGRPPDRERVRLPGNATNPDAYRARFKPAAGRDLESGPRLP